MKKLGFHRNNTANQSSINADIIALLNQYGKDRLQAIFARIEKELDSDNDGINNDDEVHLYHTDPLKKDTDDDGFDDYIEVVAGTDPNNPKSKPNDNINDLRIDIDSSQVNIYPLIDGRTVDFDLNITTQGSFLKNNNPLRYSQSYQSVAEIDFSLSYKGFSKSVRGVVIGLEYPIFLDGVTIDDYAVISELSRQLTSQTMTLDGVGNLYLPYLPVNYPQLMFKVVSNEQEQFIHLSNNLARINGETADVYLYNDNTGTSEFIRTVTQDD